MIRVRFGVRFRFRVRVRPLDRVSPGAKNGLDPKTESVSSTDRTHYTMLAEVSSTSYWSRPV